MKGVSSMQESMDIAARWTSNNDMKINPENFKEMIISFAQGSNPVNEVPALVSDGNVAKRVDNVKLLGVTLSHDLTWDLHVDNIVQKTGKRVYILYQLIRAGVRQADLIAIYISV